MKLATYLNLQHNAKVLIETYREIFDAEVICEYFYDEEMTQDKALVGKVFHAELKIGDMNLYVADTGEASSFDSMKFVIELSDEELARNYFKKLAQDGKIIHDFMKMPYGPTIADVVDQFGINWNIVIC